MNEKHMQNLTEQVHRLFTVEEVANRLHVPVSWIYERSRHDALKNLGMVRVGKYLRFRVDIVEEFVENGGDLCQK